MQNFWLKPDFFIRFLRPDPFLTLCFDFFLTTNICWILESTLAAHLSRDQCFGSVTFWYGFGSSDPCLWLTDHDVNPGGPKTYGSRSRFGSGTLVHLHHSSKIISRKEFTKKKKSMFILLFLLDEGSEAGSVPYLWLMDPGGPKIYGSGSATLPETKHSFSNRLLQLKRRSQNRSRTSELVAREPRPHSSIGSAPLRRKKSAFR